MFYFSLFGSTDVLYTSNDVQIQNQLLEYFPKICSQNVCIIWREKIENLKILLPVISLKLVKIAFSQYKKWMEICRSNNKHFHFKYNILSILTFVYEYFWLIMYLDSIYAVHSIQYVIVFITVQNVLHTMIKKINSIINSPNSRFWLHFNSMWSQKHRFMYCLENDEWSFLLCQYAFFAYDVMIVRRYRI